LALSPDPSPVDRRTVGPNQDRLPITGWKESYEPLLGGKSLLLYPDEALHSLAIHPDGKRFELGADWSLRAFDEDGKQRWQRTVPGPAWAVNISADGRLVVAAYGDDTIRWHRRLDFAAEDAADVAAALSGQVDWPYRQGFRMTTPRSILPQVPVDRTAAVRPVGGTLVGAAVEQGRQPVAHLREKARQGEVEHFPRLPADMVGRSARPIGDVLPDDTAAHWIVPVRDFLCRSSR